MIDRIQYLWPEIVLFITTCVVMVLGLSRTYTTRKMTAVVSGMGLLVATIIAILKTPEEHEVTAQMGQTLLPALPAFAKALIGIVSILLLLLMAGTVDRSEEEAIASGKRSFDPLRSNRAEFYAFFLFSITGLMLCADADDLIWLFLALELTSLPTYIMVAISASRNRAREAGVKYFFLGALGAAFFLYGFALIYGATGSTNLNIIASSFKDNGISSLGMIGLLMAIIGTSFKIAAVPMHFYTADVYEGAAPQVSAFLAFVPKTAGFLAILLLCATVGWKFNPGGTGDGPLSVLRSSPDGSQLPQVLRITLWVIAALTMSVGNVLALLQTSVKRMLAYSSIAHSGYMLVGVIAGPGVPGAPFTSNGIAAVLFYLLCYGVMNLGTFAVLAALERRAPRDGVTPREIETVSDLKGLCASHPHLGWTMVICSLSLLGLPPLLGFFGKLPLFTAGMRAGEIPLVIILGVNSAIAACYYLRLAFAPLTETSEVAAEPIVATPFRSRELAAVLSAGGVVLLALGGNSLMANANLAALYNSSSGKAGQTNLSSTQIDARDRSDRGRHDQADKPIVKGAS